METSLTVTLVAIMLLGLFELSQVQRHVVRRLQHNTTALFLLESFKNQIRYELAQGAVPAAISNESLSALIPGNDWVVSLELPGAGQKFVVTLRNRSAGKFGALYHLEVPVR